jgi:hypothetical protein
MSRYIAFTIMYSKAITTYNLEWREYIINSSNDVSYNSLHHDMMDIIRVIYNRNSQTLFATKAMLG